MKNRKIALFLLLFTLMAAIITPKTAPAEAAHTIRSTPTPRRYYFTGALDWVTSRPRSTATPAVSASPTARVNTATSLEAQMLRWINEERAGAGLPPLVWSDALSDAARTHSQDMAQGQYCSHSSPTKGGFSQRLRASGLATAGAGENVARYGSLAKAHAALMASPGHRRNLMHANYTHIGIGIVRDAQGVYYITQWTARLK